jgi:hypothetical protein
MVKIKCHKCGRMHRAHTAIELIFSDGRYYWPSDGIPGAQVKVGATCFKKIYQDDLKDLKANY